MFAERQGVAVFPAMGPERGRTEQYYRFVDASGHVYIASSLEALPADAQGKAELVELSPDAVKKEHLLGGPAPFRIDGWSFASGVAAALLLTLIFRQLPTGMRWVSKLALMVGLALLGVGLYLGYLRQSTGAGSGPLASPSALIQDAKDAVEKVQQRQRERDAELRAIEREGK